MTSCIDCGETEGRHGGGCRNTATPQPQGTWRTETVRVKDISIDPKRFQCREEVEEDRLLVMEAAGRAHCGAAFCPHRYELIELWETWPTGYRCPGEVTHQRNLFLLAGHHRVTLAWRNNVTTLEGRVAVGWSEADAIDYATRSNARVKPYAPLEEAGIFKGMSDRGQTWEQISASLDGRRPEYYRKRAGLAYLSDALKTALRDGSLRPEYAEVIGEAARRGLSVPGQQYLRDLSRTSGRRIEVFRSVVEHLIARNAPKTTQGSLFDFADDQVVAQIEEAMKDTTRQLRRRDQWAKLAHAGQQVLKNEDAQPPEVVRAIDLARMEVTRIERALGVEGSALADVDDGVAAAASPILKWVGGKRALLPSIVPVVRASLARGTGRLVSPFMGGGAVELAAAPAMGLFADNATEIIDLYKTVQSDPDAVYECVRQLAGFGCDKKTYLEIRESAPFSAVARAARTIYLNRVGYNGVYRTNKAGKFNIPHGKKSDGSDLKPAWPTVADFAAVSRALAGVELGAMVWQMTLAYVSPGDTVYSDSPYLGTYDGYGPKWSEDDHRALASWLKACWERGAEVIVSQPDCPEARAWYDWTTITDLAKTYAVGGRKERRKAKGELLCVAMHEKG